MGDYNGSGIPSLAVFDYSGNVSEHTDVYFMHQRRQPSPKNWAEQVVAIPSLHIRYLPEERIFKIKQTDYQQEALRWVHLQNRQYSKNSAQFFPSSMCALRFKMLLRSRLRLALVLHVLIRVLSSFHRWSFIQWLPVSQPFQCPRISL